MKEFPTNKEIAFDIIGNFYRCNQRFPTNEELIDLMDDSVGYLSKHSAQAYIRAFTRKVELWTDVFFWSIIFIVTAGIVYIII